MSPATLMCAVALLLSVCARDAAADFVNLKLMQDAWSVAKEKIKATFVMPTTRPDVKFLKIEATAPAYIVGDTRKEMSIKGCEDEHGVLAMPMVFLYMADLEKHMRDNELLFPKLGKVRNGRVSAIMCILNYVKSALAQMKSFAKLVEAVDKQIKPNTCDDKYDD